MYGKTWLLLWVAFGYVGVPWSAVAETASDGPVATAGPVRQGCIHSHLIRRVNFDDDNGGIIELAARQKVRLTLKNTCSGIRNNGYVHKPVNHRFCEGDTLRVMGTGGLCLVDRLELLDTTDDGAGRDAGEAPGAGAAG